MTRSDPAQWGRRPAAHLALLMLAALLWPVSGGGAPGWKRGRAALALADRARKQCPELAALSDLPTPAVVDAGAEVLSARQVGTLLLFRRRSQRPGEGFHTARVWRVDLGRCDAIGKKYFWIDGSLSAGVRYLAEARNWPTDAECAALMKMLGGEVGDPASPRHAAARLIASADGRCHTTLPGTDWTLFGPIYRPQPSFAGKPQGSGPTIWTREALQTIGASAPVIYDALLGRSQKAQSLVIWSIAPPVLKHKQGPYEIYEAALRGRNASSAVAVYDTRSGRHRWVMLSHGCVSGAIEWLAGKGEVVVGIARPTHPLDQKQRGYSLFAINLAHGNAHSVVFPLQDHRVQFPGQEFVPEPRTWMFRVRGRGDWVIVQWPNGLKTALPLQTIGDRIGASVKKVAEAPSEP